MNYLETLLIQAKAECKNIRSEAYHKGFQEAEGTANTMQKEFNAVQKLLLSVLGRERGCTETTLDTAQAVVDEFVKLKNNGECQEVNCEECKVVVWEEKLGRTKLEPKPAQRWIIECKSPNSIGDSWGKSGDTGVRGTFPSKAEAELAISNDGPARWGTILRRVTRID